MADQPRRSGRLARREADPEIEPAPAASGDSVGGLLARATSWASTPLKALGQVCSVGVRV